LGRSHNSTFQEIRPDKEDSSFLEHIKIPIKYDLKSFKVSKTIIERLSEHKDNFEGWVFVNSKNQRFKLKLEEYKRLHYILTGISNKSIWEMLSKKESLDSILDKIPDEFYFWIKKTIDDFKNSFDSIYNESKEECEKWKTLYKNSNQEYREFKKFMFFELKDNKYLHFILSCFDDKEIEDKIWKYLKPNEIKLYTKETEF
jgi:RNA ligase